MTTLKFLPAAAAAIGIFATAAVAQAPSQAPMMSTAPEPATSPSQAATPPPPATSPSSQLGPAPTVKYSFAMLDRNGDGFITRDEAALSPDLAANFSALDRNRSNSLDASEFVSFSRQK
jgi:hypothetical protein